MGFSFSSCRFVGYPQQHPRYRRCRPALFGSAKAYKYHRLQIKSNRIVGTRPLVYRRDYVTLSPVLYHTNPQDHCPAECSA